MDIIPEDQTSYNTRYKEAFLKHVDNEYSAKHRQMSVIIPDNVPGSSIFPSAKASGSGQSSFDPYDLSSDDDEYITPKRVAEMTPRQSNRTERLLTTARLYLNAPPEAPKHWWQVNPNFNDYHSDPMEISSTFWLLDISTWCHQQEETHSKYANLFNVVGDMFSIIPHGIGVEASYSLRHHIIICTQSKTTGKTLRGHVLVMQFAQANNRILPGDYTALDTTQTENNLELKR